MHSYHACRAHPPHSSHQTSTTIINPNHPQLPTEMQLGFEHRVCRRQRLNTTRIPSTQAHAERLIGNFKGGLSFSWTRICDVGQFRTWMTQAFLMVVCGFDKRPPSLCPQWTYIILLLTSCLRNTTENVCSSLCFFSTEVQRCCIDKDKLGVATKYTMPIVKKNRNDPECKAFLAADNIVGTRHHTKHGLEKPEISDWESIQNKQEKKISQKRFHNCEPTTQAMAS